MAGAASVLGIDSKHVYQISFAIGLGVLGVAGALLLPLYPVNPFVGDLFGLRAFVIVVLGGIGSIGGAFWGGYGLAQSAQATLVSMLQAELGEHGPRVSGLRPGPMRTALRGRAFQPNTDLQAKPAGDYAAACVELLSSAGSGQRGKIVDATA